MLAFKYDTQLLIEGKNRPSMTLREKASEFCDSLARLWKIHPFRDDNVTQRRQQKAT